MTKPTMPARKRRADTFLLAVALFALAYCVLGFGIRSATNADSAARLTAPVIAHAVLMTLWLVLFARQVWLVRARRIAGHRTNGAIGGVIAALLVPLGLYISWAAGREFGSTMFFALNSGAFIGFGILVAFAIQGALSGSLDRHRRFMLVATMMFMGPATARWLPMLGAPSTIAPVLLLVFIVGFPLAYDLLALRRWTRWSMVASGIAILSIALGVAAAAAASGMAA